ncbi:MAG TPA: DUF4386 domain-containing protein [Herpetosiphonaceae bacterium]|nr:DUF4386 domain-containing protein [Herpetosiphonaceae bacterium]
MHDVRAQNTAARLAGVMYLFTMVTAIASSVVRSRLIVSDDSDATAAKILASEGLFRLSIAGDLLTFACIAVLALGLYLALRTVSKPLALLGLFWRLAEATLMFALPLGSLFALRLLSGAQSGLEAGQARGLALAALNAYGSAFEACMILLGLGSIVFNYLFYVSGAIPRVLAGWGVASSIFLVVCVFAILLLPGQAALLRQIIYVPGFLGEVSLGLWLAVKGVRVQPARPAMRAALKG